MRLPEPLVLGPQVAYSFQKDAILVRRGQDIGPQAEAQAKAAGHDQCQTFFRLQVQRQELLLRVLD